MCETHATLRYTHICNIHPKIQMKHWKQSFATYMYNHCNICNISIYFYNIHMKQLQHTYKTYACNMRFQYIVTSSCCLGEWRLVSLWSSPETAA
jgi:hypothetical protein